MDEFMFRLSNQFESLQIQTSVSMQHGQQIMSTWLSQGKQFVQNDLYGQELKEFFQWVFQCLQRHLQNISNQISTISFDPTYLHQQLASLFSLDVTKREFIFFATGCITGSILGYVIVLNWCNTIPNHLHQMKAIVCHQYIGSEGISFIEHAEMPAILNPDELLIQVKAASINEVDLKICYGYGRFYRKLFNTKKYRDLPVILGRDCAGIVMDVGYNVTDFDINDRVFLVVPPWAPGVMSEYVVVPQSRVAKMPKMTSFEEATTLGFSGCIALQALHNSKIKRDNIKNKRVLVYGGTTVPLILIQLIGVWGGHVVTVCKSQAIPLLQALGAKEIIPSGVDLMKELESRDKYDVIIYTGSLSISGKVLKKYLNKYGIYVSTATPELISDSLGIITGSLFSGYMRVKLLLQYIFGANPFNWKTGSELKVIKELVDTKQLRPILNRVYPPHCTDEAFSLMNDSDTIGSIVFKIS
ncbi:hypothetical protein QAD02_017118 [Eretmocerus hayati]|uniref:Uncharacterized protein n=1 Tax=Eretmocerus hayati TaxID=131215 RepID=A0ACC2PE84_9HYME|nr:hypothetical protein QAD02_017118 [Eretmocerus hayati]